MSGEAPPPAEEPGGGETRKCQSGYVFSSEVRHAAITNFSKFHERDAELDEVAKSSLGVVGWAFAEVRDWALIGMKLPTSDGHGNCVSFKHEPKRTTPDTVAARRAQRLKLARQMIRPEQMRFFEEAGILDMVIDKIEQQAMLITDEEQGDVLVGSTAAWVDTDIEITLDSGCVDHIIDLGDAPGYEAYVAESAGSRRKQNYVVGNGARVPNEGQICLNLEHNKGMTEGVNLIKSTFQVAEISRPLMSVSRVCDMGMECRFKKDEALIVNSDGQTVARFARHGGLYIANMRLKPPEGFQGQVVG